VPKDGSHSAEDDFIQSISKIYSQLEKHRDRIPQNPQFFAQIVREIYAKEGEGYKARDG